jgi:uncharacterized protein (TIGR03067 family)
MDRASNAWGLAGGLLLAAGFFAVAAAQENKPQGDQELLQGAWLLTAGEFPDDKPKERPTKDQRLVFLGDNFDFSRPGARTRGRYRLSPAKQPKELDLLMSGDRIVGIYELRGDDLKLCFGVRDRPTTFQTSATQGLMVLKRDRSAAARDVVARARADLESRAKKPKADPAFQGTAAQSQNNLKQIALAFHNYHPTHGSFPPAASSAKGGKALLSWRVALLPYLNEQGLYSRFKLDEPWDSAHNKSLLTEMPAVFALGPAAVVARGETFYQVFVGPGTVFDGPKGRRLAEITDGTSNTVLAVEAAQAVPWTKPADLPYDPKKPLPKVGGLFPDGFHVALADGAVFEFKQDFDEPMLRRAITRADGQEVDFSKLKP